MADYESYPTIELTDLIHDDSLSDETKEMIRTVLFRRAIKDRDRKALEIFIQFFRPLVNVWIRRCIYQYQIDRYILESHKNDWEAEIFERFFNRVKTNKFVWSSISSTCQFIKTTCHITILEDKEVNIRPFKREVQRSFRINIERKRLTHEEKSLLLDIANQLPENSIGIMKLAINGYSIKEICVALMMNPCENQKIWNIKESAYWKIYKVIDHRILDINEESLLSLKDKLFSNVRKERLPSSHYISSLTDFEKM